MCAMVPCTPVVLTLPLTEPSSATRMLPLPEPELCAGGTSSLGLSFTLIALLPGIQLGMFSWYVAHDASTSTARPVSAIFSFDMTTSSVSSNLPLDHRPNTGDG